MVRDARRCRAPHHEGPRPHPEEAATRPSRRMKPRQDEWAGGIHPRRVSPSGFAYIDFTFQTASFETVMYGRPPLGKDFLAFRQTNRERSCIRPLNAAFDRGP